MEAQQFHQQVLSHLRMTNVGQNMQCANISDAEEISCLKLLQVLKKQAACDMDNN
jgi:hypothetical protein